MYDFWYIKTGPYISIVVHWLTNTDTSIDIKANSLMCRWTLLWFCDFLGNSYTKMTKTSLIVSQRFA